MEAKVKTKISKIVKTEINSGTKVNPTTRPCPPAPKQKIKTK